MDLTQSLVRQETPEERKYARYLREIEARKQSVAEKTAELESLRLDIRSFEAEYHSRLGPKFIELDRLKLSVDEYERRIARLKMDPSVDPQTIEQEVAGSFQETRDKIHQEEEEVAGYEEMFRKEQRRHQLGTGQEENLRQLYRDLARQFHPDLARTDEERKRREQVMQRINAAYTERDQQVLEAISQEQEYFDPEFERRTTGEKLVWAIREVARLNGLSASIDAELAAIRSSQTCQLWQRMKAGEMVIEILGERLTADISATRNQLANLVSTYRHLIDQQPAGK